MYKVNTVELSSVTAFSTLPKELGSINSKSSPNSSLITLAPVNKARSYIVSFLLVPKQGGSIILMLILPFTLFINNADFTC